MALRLRVVTAEGGRPGASALLMRNLVRALDLVFGIPLMAVDPLSRRLGDRLAGTLGLPKARTREEAQRGVLDLTLHAARARTLRQPALQRLAA